MKTYSKDNMPSSYTAPILSGEIKEFEDFAKICLRAMGATLHQRDEPLSTNIKLDTSTNKRLKKRLLELQVQITELSELTDKEYAKRSISEIQKEIKRHEKSKRQALKNLHTLEYFKCRAITLEYPSKEYEGYKNFMIQQLEETIKADADPEMYDDAIKSLKLKIKNFNASKKRAEEIRFLNQNLLNVTELIQEETTRRNERNKYLEEILRVLDNTKTSKRTKPSKQSKTL